LNLVQLNRDLIDVGETRPKSSNNCPDRQPTGGVYCVNLHQVKCKNEQSVKNAKVSCLQTLAVNECSDNHSLIQSSAFPACTIALSGVHSTKQTSVCRVDVDCFIEGDVIKTFLSNPVEALVSVD